MTKVTFETPTLADVIRRAASVAPTRGEAFDKAAGILMRIGADGAVVMSTDLSVFYMESVAAIRVEGDPVVWRLPSMILSAIITKLPMGSGSAVALDDDSNPPMVSLRCGRTVAKFNLLDAKYFPQWEAISADELVTVKNLGAAVKQVLWATSNSDPLLSGVAIFPDGICATDKFRMARVALETNLEEQVTVPGKVLSRIIPDNGEVRVGMVGTTFLVVPDDYTQIRTVTLGESYPNVGHLLTIEYENSSRFDKTSFLAMLNRSLDFAAGDRQATLNLIIGSGEVALFMDNQELGIFGDVVPASGSAEAHNRHKICFMPELLQSALATFPGDVITMSYNTTPGKKPTVVFTNEANYHSLVQPKRDKE